MEPEMMPMTDQNDEKATNDERLDMLIVEDSLRAQFGVDFEGGHISVQTLHVTGEHPGEALQRFLSRCHLDA